MESLETIYTQCQTIQNLLLVTLPNKQLFQLFFEFDNIINLQAPIAI